MNPTESKLYIPLTADVEVELTFRVRASNGIASDPRVITRDCGLGEAMAALSKVSGNLTAANRTTSLDYPASPPNR